MSDIYDKCFAYINAIIALAEKNSTPTEEESAIKVIAIDLSNTLSGIAGGGDGRA